MNISKSRANTVTTFGRLSHSHSLMLSKLYHLLSLFSYYCFSLIYTNLLVNVKSSITQSVLHKLYTYESNIRQMLTP